MEEDDIVDWAIRHWNEKVDRFVCSNQRVIV